MEENSAKLDNLLSGSRLFQLRELVECDEVGVNIFEIVPVGSEDTVNLLVTYEKKCELSEEKELFLYLAIYE